MKLDTKVVIEKFGITMLGRIFKCDKFCQSKKCLLLKSFPF